jgi:Protein of unknown function (DUF2971)
MAEYAYGEPGELLFHYTRAATAFEHILPDKKIRLSPYRLMRDPLEAQHWPEPSAYWVSPDDEQQDQRELARFGVVVAAKAAARLLSLTADAHDYGEETKTFGRGYARASMWQLYGDDHRGVCLAFDRERLLSALTSELADSARIMAKPVQYVRALSPDSLPSEPLKDLSPEAFHAAVDDYLERNVDLLLFTKLLDWSGEQEFRFVAVRHDDYDGSLDVAFGDTLRAVICGAELPPWQRAGAEVICREAGDVDLVRCIWHGRRPKIVRDVRGFGERA